MRTLFFSIVALLSILWIYLSFHFFKLDNDNMAYSIAYDNIFYEAIFFIGLFVFGFFLGRYFWFSPDNSENFSIFGKKEKTNFIEEESEEENENLKIIEWIWPKVEQLLKLNSINTIKQLSETGYDELKIILERAWDNFKIINPRSWPYQAELATKKEWWKLKEYQDFLVWGVDKSEFNK